MSGTWQVELCAVESDAARARAQRAHGEALGAAAAESAESGTVREPVGPDGVEVVSWQQRARAVVAVVNGSAADARVGVDLRSCSECSITWSAEPYMEGRVVSVPAGETRYVATVIRNKAWGVVAAHGTLQPSDMSEQSE